ncbi:hypothetical protein CBM2629_A80076 [Cupriavidus taiwanensis]|nr:hypothetical protein CBM2629_A80076 [Cupriavidus taiwanensis]
MRAGQRVRSRCMAHIAGTGLRHRGAIGKREGAGALPRRLSKRLNPDSNACKSVHSMIKAGAPRH